MELPEDVILITPLAAMRIRITGVQDSRIIENTASTIHNPSNVSNSNPSPSTSAIANPRTRTVGLPSSDCCWRVRGKRLTYSGFLGCRPQRQPAEIPYSRLLRTGTNQLCAVEIAEPTSVLSTLPVPSPLSSRFSYHGNQAVNSTDSWEHT